jgi:hypothetical protein
MRLSTLVGRCSTAAFIVLAAACSDMPTAAPTRMERPSLDDESLEPLDSKTTDPTGLLAKSEVAVLHIDPHVSRTYLFGDNWIYFPANSICDPATSGYGPTVWETPCSPLRTAIDVTVHWNHRGGHAYANFSPEIRFVPARNRSQYVILGLHDHKRIKDTQAYQMLYNAPGTTTWIDESLTDPTLKAWLNRPANAVLQRIKHFSGYMVAAVYGSMGGGMGDASY